MRYRRIISCLLIILILLSYILSINIPVKAEMGDVNQPLWDNGIRIEESIFAGKKPYDGQIIAQNINHPYQNAISDNEVPRIITDVSQLYTRTLLLEDYNKDHPNYRIYLKFYRWWPATCYHVAHDEWIVYHVYEDGFTTSGGDAYYVMQQFPASTYDPNHNHRFEDNSIAAWQYEGYRELPEGSTILYSRSCKRIKGYWGNFYIDPNTGEHIFCKGKDYNYAPIPSVKIGNTTVVAGETNSKQITVKAGETVTAIISATDPVCNGDDTGVVTTLEWSAIGSVQGYNETIHFDGTNGNYARPTVSIEREITYDKPGTYFITVRAVDEEYAGSVDYKLTINVIAPDKPTVTVTEKAITPDIKSYSDVASVTDLSENITMTAKINGLEDVSKIEKWVFTAVKSDVKGAETATYTIEGSAAKALTQKIDFSKLPNEQKKLTITKQEILDRVNKGEWSFNQFYELDVKVYFSSPLKTKEGDVSYITLISKPILITSVVVKDTTGGGGGSDNTPVKPDFTIHIGDGTDVTDKTLSISNAPYMLTLKDKSEGNITSRKWIYIDGNNKETVISDKNETTVSFSVPSLGVATFKLVINGNDNLYVTHYVSTSQTTSKAQPKITLTTPYTVYAGESCGVQISGSDTDGTVNQFLLYIPDIINKTVNVNPPSKSASHYFDNIVFPVKGSYYATGVVFDNDNLSAYDTKMITVLDPKPQAEIDVSGKLKVNRKVTLSAANSTPKSGLYAVEHNKNVWIIEPQFYTNKPIEEYIKFADLPGEAKFEGNKLIVTGGKDLNFLFKLNGTYKITLTVTNTYTPENLVRTSTTTKTITIESDAAPVVDFNTLVSQLRNPDNNNKASFPITSSFYSLDGDEIGYVYVTYIHDTNKNGVYGDAGDESGIVLETSIKSFIKEINENEFLMEVSKVGSYQITYYVREVIPDNETIPSLLTSQDYMSAVCKKGNIIVDNLAPTTMINLKEKREAQIQIIVNTSSGITKNDVNSAFITETLPDLVAENINADYSITASVGVGKAEVSNLNNYTISYDKKYQDVALPYDLKYVYNSSSGLFDLRVIDMRNNTYKVASTLARNKLYNSGTIPPTIFAYDATNGIVYVCYHTGTYNNANNSYNHGTTYNYDDEYAWHEFNATCYGLDIATGDVVYTFKLSDYFYSASGNTTPFEYRVRDMAKGALYGNYVDLSGNYYIGDKKNNDDIYVESDDFNYSLSSTQTLKEVAISTTKVQDTYTSGSTKYYRTTINASVTVTTSTGKFTVTIPFAESNTSSYPNFTIEGSGCCDNNGYALVAFTKSNGILKTFYIYRILPNGTYSLYQSASSNDTYDEMYIKNINGSGVFVLISRDYGTYNFSSGTKWIQSLNPIKFEYLDDYMYADKYDVPELDYDWLGYIFDDNGDGYADDIELDIAFAKNIGDYTVFVFAGEKYGEAQNPYYIPLENYNILLTKNVLLYYIFMKW